MPRSGTAGTAHNNGIIERAKQDIKIGTSACLIQAGLPGQFWTFAAPCYCLLVNTDAQRGQARWHKALGEDFDGVRLPLGCKVSYLPASTKKLQHGNWDPALHV